MIYHWINSSIGNLNGFLVVIAQIFGSPFFDAAKSAKQDKTLLWMMIIGGVLFSAFALTLYYLAQHS